MESLFLLIPLFFIVIILVPISLKIRLSYNVEKNRGVSSIYIGPIKIFLFIFKIKGKAIIVKTKKKRREIDIDFSDKQMRFIEEFTKQIEQKIRIKKFYIMGRIGLFSADKNAIIVSFISIISKIFLSILKTKKSYAQNLKAEFYPAFNQDVFQLSGFGKISISIFDILYSLIMSTVIIRRSELYERLY